MKKKMKLKWYYLAPLAILALTLFVAIGGEVVRLLWNWLVPPIIGLREITFWQALGLLLLCRILFGGLGGHNGHPKVGRRVADRIGDRIADRMAGRWAAMTPEERERFRQGARGCGLDPSTSESKD